MINNFPHLWIYCNSTNQNFSILYSLSLSLNHSCLPSLSLELARLVGRPQMTSIFTDKRSRGANNVDRHPLQLISTSPRCQFSSSFEALVEDEAYTFKCQPSSSTIPSNVVTLWGIILMGSDWIANGFGLGHIWV